MPCSRPSAPLKSPASVGYAIELPAYAADRRHPADGGAGPRARRRATWAACCAARMRSALGRWCRLIRHSGVVVAQGGEGGHGRALRPAPDRRPSAGCARCAGHAAASTPAHMPSQSLADVAPPYPCAWTFGNVGQGIDAVLAARGAKTVRIPQPGGEESLNVAAAALWSAFKRVVPVPGMRRALRDPAAASNRPAGAGGRSCDASFRPSPQRNRGGSATSSHAPLDRRARCAHQATAPRLVCRRGTQPLADRGGALRPGEGQPARRP